MESKPPNGYELVFEPTSELFDAGDDRWLEQTTSLLDDLRREAGEVRRQDVRPSEGDKGAVAAIILALGSSGAIAAAVTVFKAWLSRDRTRSIRMKRTVGGKTEVVEFTATAISEKALLEFVQSQDA